MNSAGPLSGGWPCFLLLFRCWCFCGGGVLLVYLHCFDFGTSVFSNCASSIKQATWSAKTAAFCALLFVYSFCGDTASLKRHNVVFNTSLYVFCSYRSEGMLHPREDNIIHNLETKNGRTSHIFKRITQRVSASTWNLCCPFADEYYIILEYCVEKVKIASQRTSHWAILFRHTTLFPLTRPLHLGKKI